MTTQNNTYQWFALYTKPRWERKVKDLLDEEEIENYLPLITTVKQWSDRKKKITEPLIKSYIFVKASEKEYYDILQIDGAVTYVRFGGKASPIPEWQIESIMRVIETDTKFELSNERFEPGEKVIIRHGNMEGYTGEIVKTKSGNKKIVIQVGNIGLTMVLEIGIEKVERI
jgi:transcription antitermination factor NusG